ncbi:MAG: tyrosine-type recombinase/integrase [Bacteroidetes bacterium]|nr:tyrosine-type recombinase/integrase [Bacteroidota bacterium]
MQSVYNIYRQSFLDYIVFEKRYSGNTAIAYKEDLDQFFGYLENVYGLLQLTDILPIYIRSWLADMMKNGFSARTVNRKISTLKAFFKFQIRAGNLKATPMTTIISPRISKRLPVFVEQKDTDTLLSEIDFGNDFEGKTHRLIIELLYTTGIRRDELINIKESGIDSSGQMLKVLGKGNKERLIPLSNYMIGRIKDYILSKGEVENADSTFLLVSAKGKKLYPKYVYLIVKRYLSLVTTLEKKSPHILRHTFATHLTNKGADINAVKELLGHASLAATQVYTHNTIERLKEVHKKSHPKA